MPVSRTQSGTWPPASRPRGPTPGPRWTRDRVGPPYSNRHGTCPARPRTEAGTRGCRGSPVPGGGSPRHGLVAADRPTSQSSSDSQAGHRRPRRSPPVGLIIGQTLGRQPAGIAPREPRPFSPRSFQNLPAPLSMAPSPIGRASTSSARGLRAGRRGKRISFSRSSPACRWRCPTGSRQHLTRPAGRGLRPAAIPCRIRPLCPKPGAIRGDPRSGVRSLAAARSAESGLALGPLSSTISHSAKGSAARQLVLALWPFDQLADRSIGRIEADLQAIASQPNHVGHRWISIFGRDSRTGGGQIRERWRLGRLARSVDKGERPYTLCFVRSLSHAVVFVGPGGAVDNSPAIHRWVSESRSPALSRRDN